ncbi:MAG: NifU N-terminal domain-containing protein [Gemmatimonadota bacterium]
MAELNVTVEGTPNPNAAKFVLDRPLPVTSGRSYFDPSATEGDSLAARLFAVNGVRALFLVDNFITVTKAEEIAWSDIVAELENAIRAELAG